MNNSPILVHKSFEIRCKAISVWNNSCLVNNTFGHERSKSAFSKHEGKFVG